MSHCPRKTTLSLSSAISAAIAASTLTGHVGTTTLLRLSSLSMQNAHPLSVRTLTALPVRARPAPTASASSAIELNRLRCSVRYMRMQRSQSRLSRTSAFGTTLSMCCLNDTPIPPFGARPHFVPAAPRLLFAQTGRNRPIGRFRSMERDLSRSARAHRGRAA